MSAVAAPLRITDDAGYAKDSHRWWVLGVVGAGSLMSILDTTVVNIALPKLMAVFNTDVHGAQWVLTSYLLALAIVIPLTGYLDETFGGKRVYIISLVLFTIASAFCGFAWSMPVMIAFRVIQGLGGGLIQPLGFSMALREFAPEERGTALSFLGMPLMLGPALGPTFGGFLVEYVDWRLIFFINLPVGIIAIIAASRILHRTPTDNSQKLDAWGIALAGIGSAALLLGIDNGPTDGWGSLAVMAELAIGVLLLISFVVVELRVFQPLLDLRLFRSAQFSVAVFVTLVIQVGLFGASFLLPVFLQNLRGLGAMETGMLLIPMSLTVAFVMPISGRLFDRYGPQLVMIPGLVLLTVSTYMFTRLDVTTSSLTIVEVLMLRGFGMGLAMMPAMTCSMNAVPRPMIPRATALTQALQRISGSFGTAIMATVLTARQNYQFAMAAQTVTPFNTTVQQTLGKLQYYFEMQHMTAVASQQLQAWVLYEEVSFTAAVRSFDDTFYVATLICIPSIVAAFFVHNTSVKRDKAAEPILME